MVKVELNVHGDVQLQRTMLRITDRIHDMTPAWEAIADAVAENNTRNFAAEGAYAGQRWAALSPAYRRWKERHFPGLPILQLSGHLRGELTSRPFGFEDIGPTRMRIGSALPYAAAHQLGTARLPQRRPLELSEATRQNLVRIMQRFVVTGQA